MALVMVVPVERQRPLGAEAEQRAILRRRRDHRRRALAADVAVEADHPVRRRHHHVQVVADHQHARSRARRGSARSAGRSAPRPAGRGPAPPRRAPGGPAAAAAPAPAAPAGTGRPRAPPSAARRGRRCPTRSSAGARSRASPLGEPEEAPHRHRQRRVDRQPLRHVADPQPRRAHDPPRVRPLGPDQQPQERALARAVRPDDRHDLARVEREVHPARAPGARRRTSPGPAASISGVTPAHCPPRGSGRRAPRPPSPSARWRSPPPPPRSMSAPRRPRQRRLGDPAAAAADQEAGVVRRPGMGAGGEGRRAARSGARSRSPPGSRAPGRRPAAGCRAPPRPARSSIS